MANVSQSLTLTQQSQSIEGNYSTVRVLWTSTQDSNSYNNNTRTAYYYVSVNGGTEKEYSVSYTLPKNTTKTILDTTITVYHNDNGTGSVSVRTWMDTRISAGVVEKSASLTLDTIPRKSSLSVPNGTLDTSQNMTVTKKASSFTHTITYKCGSASGTVCTKSSSTSVSWKPPIELASQAPQNESVAVTFTITTYNGSTAIGSDTASATYAIPSNIRPPVSSSVTDIMGHKDTYGKYVQGQSKLSFVIETYGSYGAWIKSFRVEVDGKAYTTGTTSGNYITVETDVIQGSGTLPVKITVTDSRNRPTIEESSIDVLAYKFPQITALSAYRSDANGTSKASGAYITVKFSTKIYSLNEKNGAWYKVVYKKSGETTEHTITLDTFAGQYVITNGKYTFPAEDYSYDIVFKAGDRFLTSKQAVTGAAVEKIFSLLKKSGKIVGAALGKIAELENVFDIKYKVKFTGGIYPNGDYVEEHGVTDGWTWRKWNSGEAECWKTFKHSTAVSTAWGSFYSGTATTRQDYPFGFTEKPTEIASLTAGTYQGILFPEKNGNGVNGTYQSACYNICRPSSVDISEFYISLYVKGKWK